jgi:hypothetical protein
LVPHRSKVLVSDRRLRKKAADMCGWARTQTMKQSHTYNQQLKTYNLAFLFFAGNPAV